MWIPIVLFCLLFLGAVVVAVLAQRASDYEQPTAVALAALSLLLGGGVWWQAPTTVTLLSWSESGLGLHYGWTFDELTTAVTLSLLLLLFVTVLVIPTSARSSATQYPVLFILTAVTLAAVWADSLLAMTMGWFVLLGVWMGALGWVGRRAGSKKFLGRVGLLVTAVMFLWLGAASAPDGFAVATWSTREVTTVLAAAVLQLGIWPVFGWRPTATNLPVSLALWLIVVPVVTGAVLFMRVLAIGMAALPVNGLFLTLLGLFGLLYAIRQAWMRLHLPIAVAAYLSLAVVHLFLLTAVWADTAAALAMLQVFIVGSGVLYLASGRPLARPVWWRFVPPVVVVAALAGLPLTVGLGGHLALYEGLLAQGRGIIFVVLVFLQMPMLTAVMRLFWSNAEAETMSMTRHTMMQDGALLILTLGLLTWRGLRFDGHWLAWVGIILVPVGGLVLFRFTREFRQTTAAVRQAFTLRLPEQGSSESLGKLAGGIGEAFREAAAILEGDGSLLWLLALILILLLVR